MSHTPGGGNPQGWDNTLADRSSLPPVPGEERGRPLSLYPEVPNFHRYHGGRGSSSGKKAVASGDTACGSNSPPAYLRWARDLRDLFKDADGVQLFQRFVSEAGPPHTDRLNFYFACEGLKLSKDPSQIKSLIAAIYKFLKKSQLTIPEDVRRKVKLGLKDEETLEVNIFDSMQIEAEKLIKETTYLSFLQSDTFLQHAQNAQHTNSSSIHSSGSISSSSSSKELCGALPPYTLATLHEGEELTTSMPIQVLPSTSQMPQRLTKNLLMATQERRLQNEGFSGGFGRNKSVYSYAHVNYTGYCPTSKQDSELQSMSSGRTDSDALSMSGSSVDGMSICRGSGHPARREHSRRLRGMLESATMNKSIPTQEMLIPRTLRIQKGQCTAMKPDDFAQLLMEKLEKVKRDQDQQEKLERKMSEIDADCPNQPITARVVAAAIREKLQLDDDNDQDILDQHVSRVWSDLTPARSPGRPTSPPHPHPHLHSRRHRDMHSTLSAQSALSADSGNVRDFSDTLGSDRASSNVSGVSKSRSVPDYNDPFLRQTLGRRSLSRKTLTDLTDSGVSVVSDTPPVHPSMLASSYQPNSRILTWIQEGVSNTDRYGRKSFSRSGSSERPGQPIATDPQMPPLPSPHTATQLDEARRRLLEHQSPSISGPSALLPRHPKRSGQSSGKIHPPPVVEPLSTTVIITFLDESVPYRTKIPAAPVTLKHFKEFLPKKGNYRYFFKTKCEELENTPIQEEIFNDSDNLPLWEGKIMAKVKNVE